MKRMTMWVLAVLYAPTALLAQAPTFRLAGHDVEVVGELGGWALSVEVERPAPGVEIAHIRLVREGAARPPDFTLKWSLPAHDVVGQWTRGPTSTRASTPTGVRLA